MKTFVPGFVLGAAVSALILMVVLGGDGPDPSGPAAPPSPEEERSDAEPSPPRTDYAPGLPARRLPEESADTPDFEPGTAVLRIGDGYVFGEPRIRPAAEESGVDLLCLDIGAEVSLRCPHGSRAAALPVVFSGETPRLEKAFDLLRDSPVELERTTATLGPEPSGLNGGVVLVSGADGRAHKVVLVEKHMEPFALRRFVKLRFAEVPRRAGGGVVPLPGAGESRIAGEKTVSEVRKLFERPERLSASWASGLPSGPFAVVKSLPPDFEVENRGTIVIEEPLRTTVTVNTPVTLVLRGGLHPEGRIAGTQRIGLIVEGDLEGVVDTGIGYVRVTGAVTGRLRTSGTAVIDGDVTGVVEVHGIPTILLRARVRDPATGLVGSGIPTFYFERYTPLLEIRQFKKEGGIWKLHVKRSDLPEGKQKNGIGIWSDVTVADPIWESLSR